MNDRTSDTESEFDTWTQPASHFGPGARLLMMVGLGLVIGAVVQAFRPAPKPQERFARLLEDMEDRLRSAGAPAIDKASSFAMDGVHAASDRLHRGEAQVEKFLRTATKRLRKMVA